MYEVYIKSYQKDSLMLRRHFTRLLCLWRRSDLPSTLLRVPLISSTIACTGHRGLDSATAEQQEPIDKVNELVAAIGSQAAEWYVEDGVELFERLGLGLWKEEKNEHPADDVPSRVPAKGTGRGEGGLERGPRYGQHKVEEPCCCGGQGHARRSNVERVCLCRVSEGDGPHTGRVEYTEEVDAEGNACQVSRVFLRNEKAEASEEEG
jgi:hypothetical protein